MSISSLKTRVQQQFRNFLSSYPMVAVSGSLLLSLARVIWVWVVRPFMWVNVLPFRLIWFFIASEYQRDKALRRIGRNAYQKQFRKQFRRSRR